MMWILLFLIVYVLSVILSMWLDYKTCDYKIETLGELIDYSKPLTFIPIINTIVFLIGFILTIVSFLYYTIKLDILFSDIWHKIRNIKLN